MYRPEQNRYFCSYHNKMSWYLTPVNPTNMLEQLYYQSHNLKYIGGHQHLSHPLKITNNENRYSIRNRYRIDTYNHI